MNAAWHNNKSESPECVLMDVSCYVSGKDLFQIRGQNGLLHNSMDPLPEVSGKQDVSDTVDHIVETFYPVSPTIDLQKVHVYKEDVNCLGEESSLVTEILVQ